ncbi:MAG: 2,3,4,5-tetrahydropyridine-2,6-dicarboxylate N-succinyltransferase [Spirochaetales bacterium]|nr:2,3,4,5-tetrahydropyridine-2,6-dicarboxylate N-succinyltransferase [Spirochaetales bacterium]
MNIALLKEYYNAPAEEIAARPDWAEAHASLLDALESGDIAATERGSDDRWRAVPWVKGAILTGFKASAVVPVAGWPGGASDKAAYPPRIFNSTEGVRVVPGGTSVRRGARVEAGVVIMPPAYINVGAVVGSGSMVDSHALVGSCARVGKGVHLSAGVQLGGVLEPAGALPVVIEDGVFAGALSAVLEGVVVGERAVLAPGVILTASVIVYDLVKEREWRGEIPPGAVVVQGSRPAQGAYARTVGLQLYAPCIVKYRDATTDASLVLESALREASSI